VRRTIRSSGVIDMADYVRTIGVEAPADRVFECLADPANMPKYVAMMTTAQPGGGDTVHVAAEVQGRHEEGDAHVSADPRRRRLEWGGAGEGGYRGWLEVVEAAGGASVTVQIHTARDRPDDEALINRSFDETMERIRELVDTGD
jgi:uncharacterized protein YndB with AHSA1/START domain